MPLQDSDFHMIMGDRVAISHEPSILVEGKPYGDPDSWGKYVIKSGSGYSCLGFDVCMKRTARYLAWLTEKTGRTASPNRTIERGTLAAYAAYKKALKACIAVANALGIPCDAELTPQLKGLEGKRVEVVDTFGDGKPRRFWVGRSMGPLITHLEIHNTRSHGGMAAWSEYKSVQVIR